MFNVTYLNIYISSFSIVELDPIILNQRKKISTAFFKTETKTGSKESDRERHAHLTKHRIDAWNKFDLEIILNQLLEEEFDNKNEDIRIVRSLLLCLSTGFDLSSR